MSADEMGVCISIDKHEDEDDFKAAQRRNLEIERELKRAMDENRKLIRLLLLGAGGCGKSTLLKQMRIIHGNGFEQQELEKQKKTIRANMVDQMMRILEGMKRFDFTYELNSSEDAEAHLQSVIDHEEHLNFGISLKTVSALRLLWADPGVKSMADRGAELFHMNESAPYFFDHIDRVVASEYVPTEQDILYNRVCTVGIVRFPIKMHARHFMVFDVGGQRSQRRKWIHCFDDVTAVIFMSALSEFDQQMDEDETTNRMDESMHLFESVVNSPFFEKASMILFMNKRDLFEQKISAGKSIKKLFPHYRGATGPDSFEEQSDYVVEKFVRVKTNPDKAVYAHKVCATDTNQVQVVLESSIDTIIQQMLGSSGIT